MTLHSEEFHQPRRDDNKLYCVCGEINYGEMIGWDGPDCETEWFHLACVEIDPTRNLRAAGTVLRELLPGKGPEDWEEG